MSKRTKFTETSAVSFQSLNLLDATRTVYPFYKFWESPNCICNLLSVIIHCWVMAVLFIECVTNIFIHMWFFLAVLMHRSILLVLCIVQFVQGPTCQPGALRHWTASFSPPCFIGTFLRKFILLIKIRKFVDTEMFYTCYYRWVRDESNMFCSFYSNFFAFQFC